MTTTPYNGPIYPETAYRDYAGRWRDNLGATSWGTIECQHGTSIDEPCDSCAYINAAPDDDDPADFWNPHCPECGEVVPNHHADCLRIA